MNRKEWQAAEEALKSLYGQVILKVDDYEVTLRLGLISTYKNGIMVYVNGKFKGQWLFEDCEERRRFLRRKERLVTTPKQRAAFNKMSKRMQKEYQDLFDRKYESYDFYWSSFNALRKHLIENNESIEVIKIERCAI